MKISVVIPAYNEEKYIRDCLESLFRQKFKDFEVIISLNACTDNTRVVVEDFIKEKKATNIRLVEESRKGVALARQKGCLAARGEIIASGDADTFYPDNWLSIIDDDFKKKKNVVLFYGPVFMSGRNLLVKWLAKYAFSFFILVSRLFGLENVNGMNFAIRKDVFDKIGGYNLRIKSAEDIDLARRVKKLGKIYFDIKLKVYSSPRRFRLGYFSFFKHHIKNYINIFLLKKEPEGFEDVR